MLVPLEHQIRIFTGQNLCVGSLASGRKHLHQRYHLSLPRDQSRLERRMVTSILDAVPALDMLTWCEKTTEVGGHSKGVMLCSPLALMKAL